MALTIDFAGRVLGKRYRLLTPLGTGASSHVFLAEDLMLRRQVAVKVLLPALAQDESFLQRFRAEARAAGSLNHPHVMRVFDWGEDADGPYLVLEYLGGGTLRQLLDRPSLLTPAQAVHMGSQAAQGLAYAHARGIVHRDIKPANLLFDEEARVRVADFGVARALAEATWTEPAGAVIGTARYVSPEQAQGHSVDGRADVYALALVLYESVTGTVPFAADTPVGTLMARIGQALPPHEALGPLAEVLAWAADPTEADRPPAAEVVRRLDALAATLPPPAPLALGVHRGGGSVPATGSTGHPWDRAGSPSDLTGVAGTAMAGGSATAVARPADATDLRTGVIGPAVGGAMPPVARVPSGAVPLATGRRRRRRALPWILALVGLAMLLAAGAIYAVREKIFTPSHPVPHLSGLTLAGATHSLHQDSFTLAVGGHQYSTTVAKGRIIDQHPSPATSLKEGSTVHVVVSKGLPPEAVPSLLGIDCTAAQRVLSVANLSGTCPPGAAQYSTTVPKGQVITWSYKGQDRPVSAPWHSTITVVVSNGPPPVTIPNVVGQSYSAAANELSQKGLKATETQQSSTTPAGEVIKTDPATGQQLPEGSTVTVYVSTGPPKVQVPLGLLGSSLSEAKAILRAAGLSVGSVSGPHGGQVTGAQPASGKSVAQGSVVNLTMASHHGTTKSNANANAQGNGAKSQGTTQTTGAAKAG